MTKAAEDEKTWRLFPPSYQEYLSAAHDDVLLKKRVVVDYVAGMTEHEIVRIHACLTGRA
jgi:dGTP triphosphohydrolase